MRLLTYCLACDITLLNYKLPLWFRPRARGRFRAAPAFLRYSNMRTFVYIDGFNFYYRAVKNTQYKWLDFKKLFQNLLDPKHDIISIKYFTAIVSGKIDPDQPIRQKTFIRALQKHIPEFSVYYGMFLSHPTFQPLVSPIDKNVFGKDINCAISCGNVFLRIGRAPDASTIFCLVSIPLFFKLIIASPGRCPLISCPIIAR